MESSESLMLTFTLAPISPVPEMMRFVLPSALTTAPVAGVEMATLVIVSLFRVTEVEFTELRARSSELAIMIT